VGVKERFFIYHRWLFELEHPDNVWCFTKDELDLAEKHPDGFVGLRMGINCYLIRFGFKK